MSKLALYNKLTGEVIEVDNLIVVGNKARKGEKDKNFVKVFTTFLEDLFQDNEISGKAIRLLLYMINNGLDYESLTIRIIPKYAIKDLKVDKTTFYKWLKVLIRKGILKKVDTYTYILSAYTVVKGNAGKAYEKHLKDLEKKKFDDAFKEIGKEIGGGEGKTAQEK